MTSFEITINVSRLLGDSVVIPAWPNPDPELVDLCEWHDRLAGAPFNPVVVIGAVETGNDERPVRGPAARRRDTRRAEAAPSEGTGPLEEGRRAGYHEHADTPLAG